MSIVYPANIFLFHVPTICLISKLSKLSVVEVFIRDNVGCSFFTVTVRQSQRNNTLTSLGHHPYSFALCDFLNALSLFVCYVKFRFSTRYNLTSELCTFQHEYISFILSDIQFWFKQEKCSGSLWIAFCTCLFLRRPFVTESMVVQRPFGRAGAVGRETAECEWEPCVKK